MKEDHRYAASVIFRLSFLYYVFWILYSVKLYFTGIDSGWLIPSLSSYHMLYGLDAFFEGLGMGFIFTVLRFWFIPLYQVIYIIISIIMKIRKKTDDKKMKKQ